MPSSHLLYLMVNTGQALPIVKSVAIYLWWYLKGVGVSSVWAMSLSPWKKEGEKATLQGLLLLPLYILS